MLAWAAASRSTSHLIRRTPCVRPTAGNRALARLWAPVRPLRRTAESLRAMAAQATPVVDTSAARAVGWWLAGMSGAVFGMVAVGGYTRLTRSGLSMTEWRLTGSKLPSTVAEWEVEFKKYKDTPEYRKLNMGMSLEEFKSIYFWEWFHRMWGRSLGIAFAVPAAIFIARKSTRQAISQFKLYPRLALLFGLGGTQGLVGWWMVKSGLDHTHVLGFERDESDMPRVSPYRLATHLSFAFVTYGVLTWTSMGLLSNPGVHEAETARISRLGPEALRSLRKFKTGVHGTASLIGLTIFSGAFVAGNLAGLVYGDWPLMGGRFIPAGISEEWERFTPRVRNAFENIAMVQFDHRMLAYSTLAAGTGVLVSASRMAAILPANTLFRARLLAGVVWAQASLGVATILYNVPVSLGVLHQTGALTAWTAAIWLMHSLRPITAASRFAAAPVAAAAAATAAAAGCVVAVADGKPEGEAGLDAESREV